MPTFWTGYKRDLEITDLCVPLKEHTSSILGNKIADAWNKECQIYEKQKEELLLRIGNDNHDKRREKKLKQPSLLRVIIKCFGLPIMMYGLILAVMEIVLRYNMKHLLA